MEWSSASESGEFRLASVESRTFDLWRLKATTPEARERIECQIRELYSATRITLAMINAGFQSPAAEQPSARSTARSQ
jgi:hypothetical protein